MAFNGIMPPKDLVPAPFGLLSVADVVVPTEDEWVRGYAATFMSHPQLVQVLSQLSGNIGDEGVVYKASDDITVSPYEDVVPFFIEVTSKGSTLGASDLTSRTDNLKAQLEVVTQKAAEYELWTGAVIKEDGENQSYLTKNTSKVITTGAVTPKRALTMIEGAIAGSPTGTGGVIHVSRELGSALTFMGAVSKVENEDGTSHLETVLGTKVIVGSGYLGTSPDGTANPTGTDSWMYATGPVTLVLGPAEVTSEDAKSSVDPRTNDLLLSAIRPASVHFDTSIFYAAQVTIPEAP